LIFNQSETFSSTVHMFTTTKLFMPSFSCGTQMLEEYTKVPNPLPPAFPQLTIHNHPPISYPSTLKPL